MAGKKETKKRARWEARRALIG